MLRIVGDCHGLYNEYLQLVRDSEHSIQVGDLGLHYKFLRDSNINWENHRVLGGNHDNYLHHENNDEYFHYQPFALPDYGMKYVDDKEIFFTRGAWSIDRKYRTEGISWFPEEELSTWQLEEAIRIYKNVKPEIVITHECPLSVVPYVTNPTFTRNFGYSEGVIKTRTNQALEQMFYWHKPKQWLFGHYHTRREIEIEGTEFICLDMIRQPLAKDCYYDLI